MNHTILDNKVRRVSVLALGEVDRLIIHDGFAVGVPEGQCGVQLLQDWSILCQICPASLLLLYC